MLVGRTKVELENKTFFVSFSRVCNSWAHLGFLWTQSITYLAIKNEDIKKKNPKPPPPPTTTTKKKKKKKKKQTNKNKKQNKKNEDILRLIGKQMEPENTMLSEVTQTQKNIHGMYSLTNGY